MPNVFLSHWWPGVLVWGALYVLDFAMTMRCARLYRDGAREKIRFEGSYEITPIFQRDVDRLRVVSPRFLVLLVLYATLLGVTWSLTVRWEPRLYMYLLGGMIGVQMAVHIRHFRNFVLFRNLIANEGVRGRIEYSRPVVLRISAAEIGAFGMMFAILAALTVSWFLVGAAMSCMAMAWKHYQWAGKQTVIAQEKSAAVAAR